MRVKTCLVLDLTVIDWVLELFDLVLVDELVGKIQARLVYTLVVVQKLRLNELNVLCIALFCCSLISFRHLTQVYVIQVFALVLPLSLCFSERFTLIASRNACGILLLRKFARKFLFLTKFARVLARFLQSFNQVIYFDGLFLVWARMSLNLQKGSAF